MIVVELAGLEPATFRLLTSIPRPYWHFADRLNDPLSGGAGRSLLRLSAVLSDTSVAAARARRSSCEIP